MRTPIFHVVAPSPVGGLERVVQTLAVEQRAAGETVHVAAVVSRGEAAVADAFLAPLDSADVGVHRVELPPRRYLGERAAVLELCRQHRPGIVHTHGYRPDLVDGAVAHAVDAAAVTTVHGFTGGGARGRCYEWLQRRAFRRFDAVVAVSRPLAFELVRSGVPADRVHFVLNAWRPTRAALGRDDARAALGLPRDAFVIGWAGRLSREKGPDVLIDALTALRALPIRASVLGDGPERRALEARARRHGVADRITWHGVVRDADTLFPAFDAFVLSSRTEGTPMALFEALAAGVPVIATRVGGVPDLIRPDEGVLVAPGDSRALAEAIRDLHRHLDAARIRARSARERVAATDRVGSWIASYAAVYRAALAAALDR